MKYTFTGKAKDFFGVTLRQVQYDNGEVGGWIEKESNLSQSGHARVDGNARVAGNAQVYGNARVLGNALVTGDALVSGNARVYGNARYV